MSYNPYKSSRFTINLGSHDYDNKYLNYKLFLNYVYPNTNIVRYELIYNGKTLVVNGTTTIDVSDIIRDYSFRETIKYNEEKQRYEVNDINPLPLNTVDNIEYLYKLLVNSNIRIEVVKENGDSLSNITKPFSIYVNNNVLPPVSIVGGTLTNYNKSDIANHIPYIKTEEYWVNLSYVISNQNKTVYPALKAKNSSNVKLMTNKRGNYFNNITLKNFITTIENSLFRRMILYTGGDSRPNFPREIFSNASTTSILLPPVGADLGIYNRGEGVPLVEGDKIMLNYYKGQTVVKTNDCIVVVDKDCPSRYYLTWYDEDGWHSVSLRNVTEVREDNRLNISNIYNETINISNTITKKFRCKSNKLTNEEVEGYVKMIQSPYVVLYDTNKDKSYFCNLTTTTTEYIKKNVIDKYFEFEIEEIIKDNR